MDSDLLIKTVSEHTGFDRDRAALLLRTTLVTLGSRIAPGEADDLAAQLPETFAACVRNECNAERFGPDEFKRRVARIVPLATEQAGDAIGAVFAALTAAVSAGEMEHVYRQLGAAYEPLVMRTSAASAS